MKTPPMMVLFLPRFRWFTWGFGLCTLVTGLADGSSQWPSVIFLFLGVLTYPPEWVNARMIENTKRIDALQNPANASDGANKTTPEVG